VASVSGQKVVKYTPVATAKTDNTGFVGFVAKSPGPFEILKYPPVGNVKTVNTGFVGFVAR